MTAVNQNQICLMITSIGDSTISSINTTDWTLSASYRTLMKRKKKMQISWNAIEQI